MPDFRKAKLKYIKVLSIPETMKAMAEGERIVIPRSIMNNNTIRNWATRLKEEGYKFFVSVSGRKADTLIIKLKDAHKEQPEHSPLFSDWGKKEQKEP